MPADILRDLQIPECLATRPLAGIAVPRVYQGRFPITESDIHKLDQVINALEGISGDFTLGLIKPRAFEGKKGKLPRNDVLAEQIILGEIDKDRIALRLPFQLTKFWAALFYEPLRKKYSQRFNSQQNRYNLPGVSIFDAIVNFTSCAPLTIMILDGDNAIEYWRERMGETNSDEADPNSIRGKFGDARYMPNTLVHGSDSEESAHNEFVVIKAALVGFSCYTKASTETLRAKYYSLTPPIYNPRSI